MSTPPRVKICGLTRPEDAVAAESAGASYGGVVFAPGRRTVNAARAAAVLAGTGLIRVGVFVNAPAEELVEAARFASLQVLQLHGDETPSYIAQIRQSWDGEIWKVLRPREPADLLAGLELFASCVDGVLLDGWSPTERGGVGARLPWAELAGVRDRVPSSLSFAIAGGLTPENVAVASRFLRPDLVDVSSGVERAPGIKDPSAVQRFVAAVRAPSS